MSDSERPLGKIGLQSVSDLADRAAERIRRAKRPRAVCVSPDGYVTVEPAGHAMPDDIAGTYSPDTQRLDLWRLITEDMQQLIADRPVVPMKQRHVYAGRAKKEAA